MTLLLEFFKFFFIGSGVVFWICIISIFIFKKLGFITTEIKDTNDDNRHQF